MSTPDQIPPFPAPDVQTIAAAALRAADLFGNRPALVDEDGRTLTFRAYIDRALDVAAALVASGVEVGDRIAIWAPNCADYAVTVLGIQFAGAALVPLNTRFTVIEASEISARASIRAIFTSHNFLGRPYAEEFDAHRRAHPQVLGAEAPLVTLDAGGAVPFETFIARATAAARTEVARRIAGIEPADTAIVLFTSGTTGRPKGIRLGHGQLLRAYWQWGGILGVEAGDRMLLSNPFFHAFGLLVGLLLALARGVTAYPMAVFTSAGALRAIEQNRITVYPAPPTVFQMMLQDPLLAATDTSSLRIAVTGATSIPPSLIHAMHDELGIESVFSPYGLTEATGVATLTRSGDAVETIADTAGRAVPGVEVRILRGDGTFADTGEVGEICVRGYNTQVSYLDDARPLTDEDGYLHTGDLGTIDADGNLRVTGRLKDMYIVGGFNVYPVEIEAAITAHPGISAAAVVVTSDERLGEVGVAFVVPDASSPASEDELVALCTAQLANYKRPRRFVFVDALPVNASGKVMKDVLARQLAGG